MDKFQGDSGSQAGMTRLGHYRPVRGENLAHTVIPAPIKLGMTLWISSKAIPARRPEWQKTWN